MNAFLRTVAPDDCLTVGELRQFLEHAESASPIRINGQPLREINIEYSSRREGELADPIPTVTLA